MPGPREKLSVLEGKGRKHLSEQEKAQRAAQEINLPKPAKLPVPKWLPPQYRTAFRKLSKQLLEVDIGVAELDADTVARYVVAQANYTAVLPLVQKAMTEEDVAMLKEYTKAQNTYFTQARACANDMGMTITSRCRLVLPESSQPKEPNAFEEMLRRKMQG